jgi:hypothetical protein
VKPAAERPLRPHPAAAACRSWSRPQRPRRVQPIRLLRAPRTLGDRRARTRHGRDGAAAPETARLRGSRWPVCSRSSSARPDAAPARAKAKTRSPTSCGQPSKRYSTISTAGSPRPQARKHQRRGAGSMLLASYLTRPAQAGRKPSQRLIPGRSSPARRHMIVTASVPGPGTPPSPLTSGNRPRAGAAQNTQACARQLLSGTNPTPAPNTSAATCALAPTRLLWPPVGPFR